MLTTNDKFLRLLDAMWDFEAHPNMRLLHDLYLSNQARILKSPGSSYNHQCWEGGYVDHLYQMWAFSQEIWNDTLGIELPDVLLVIALHDIEKPWKYVSPLGKPDLRQFHFTDVQANALKYVHGEGDDYKKHLRVMNELAAFVHMADIWSARILHSRRD